MKTLLLAALLTLSSSFGYGREAISYGGFTFSNDIPLSQVKLLKSDIDYLYALPEMKDTDNLQKFAGLEGLAGLYFHNWILNRMHFFVPEKASLDLLFGETNQTYNYANPQTLPGQISNSTNSINENATVLATNIGGALYLISKQSKNLGTATVNGRTMPILSPRIGIVQIHDAYFSKDQQVSADPAASINRLVRLSTLFHEARHSDGQGKNVGFVHAECPKGHPFEGSLACDTVENGSYGLEARFDRMLSKNCTDCKPSDIEALRMMSLDYYSRLVLPPAATARMVKLKQVLNTYSYILKLCRASDIKDADCSPAKIKETQQKYLDTRAQLDYMVRSKATEKPLRPVVDGKAEGYFQEMSLEETKALMTPQ